MGQKISIVICVKDAEESLARTFDSLLNQTISNELFTVVTVNDGSIDNSLQVIEEYAAQFHSFTRMSRDENKGVVYTMNEGIRAVASDWFMRLDPDDTLAADALEQFIKKADNGYDLVLSHRLHVSGNTEKTVAVDDNIFTWIGCGVLIQTKKALEVNLYNNLMWEEYDFYVRYLQQGYNRYHIIDRPLYTYRISEGSITSSELERKKGFQELIDIHTMGTLEQYGFTGADYIR